MILYSPKGVRTWTSSGVTITNGKLEMSNFSFIEESFVSTSQSYSLNLIGKNIIGNGSFTISVYLDGLLVSTEVASFSGIYHSKKQIQFTANIGSKAKISISRGKQSSGKILIDQAAIHITPEPSLKQEIILEPEIIDDKLTVKDIIVADDIVHVKKERKKRTTKPKIKKDELAGDTIVPSVIEPKEKISAAIIDLNIINSERDFFNFLNQISFGKNTQRFFIKQSASDPKDLTKYPNVIMFSEEKDLIENISNFDVFKMFYNKGNLQGALLERAEQLKCLSS